MFYNNIGATYCFLIDNVGISQAALVVKKKIKIKNLPASAGYKGDTGSIPGSGRTRGGGHGNPLQYSRLKNSHRERNLVGCSS